MGSYLSPEEIAYQLTNISDDRRTDIVASTIVLAVLATVAVILRLFCRRFTNIALSWDDYLIVIGLVRVTIGIQVRFGGRCLHVLMTKGFPIRLNFLRRLQ